MTFEAKLLREGEGGTSSAFSLGNHYSQSPIYAIYPLMQARNLIF